jgi:hypothetical protein
MVTAAGCREFVAHVDHVLDARGLVADRHRQALAGHEAGDQPGRLGRLARLFAEEREHAGLGDPAAVDPRQHAEEVGLEQGDALERAGGEALEVVGGEQLHVGRGVLAEAQQVLVAVDLLEEAGHELAAERLDVGADAVAHGDEHVGGELVLAERRETGRRRTGGSRPSWRRGS